MNLSEQDLEALADLLMKRANNTTKKRGKYKKTKYVTEKGQEVLIKLTKNNTTLRQARKARTEADELISICKAEYNDLIREALMSRIPKDEIAKALGITTEAVRSRLQTRSKKVSK